MRLKTKLVLAISSLVTAVVVTLSTLYIERLLGQRVDDLYQSGDFVAHQIFHAAREALEIDLRSTSLDAGNAAAVEAAIEESLQTDPGLNSLLQSIVGYSPTIYDAAITDAGNRVLLHTDPASLGKRLPPREDFSRIRRGSFWRRMRIVYGRPRVYDVQVPLLRDGKPAGAIRVGISTVFLRSELRPLLNNALAFSGIAVVVSFILAAALSNLALRPLETIARRLDLMTVGATEAAAEPAAEGADEVGAVTTKIDRLGRQMRDVKEVFSALKENLDQIMANLQDGLILFTRDARAVLVSASVELFLGRPRGQTLGYSIHEIFSGNTRLGGLVLDAFLSQRPLDQYEVETENGRRAQVSLDFIEERGERIGALLTLHDAESVRRIEDEIELSRRLSAIGRLTSGVAHEVKNPINAMVVHLELLRQKLQTSDPDSRRHMDVIAGEIQRLDRVVQTLVDFTRPVELRLRQHDLRQVVEDVLLLAAPDAERQGVSIVREPAGEALPVRIDADLVKQAVLNVVLNGVQAMPQGGALSIAARREREEAQVEVRDQGPGIPAEIRDRIFNLYFTTKAGGTGLGLPMAYRVMQLHNGAMEFDSPSGGGAVFRLRFPLLGSERDHEAARSEYQVPST